MSVKRVFDRVAKDYDAARKMLIPCFNDFYGTVVDLIRAHENSVEKVLDLGAGTGLLSAMIMNQLQEVEFSLCDISDKMLDEAKIRFEETGTKINYLVKDYSKEPFAEKFDCVVSALSIHHLSGPDKERLYKKIYDNLNEGGLFINADQVLGETESIERIYRATWIEQVKARGATQEILEAAFERMKQDKMSTLSEQLSWLNNAGFHNINCWYKNYSFVVYSGNK